MTPKRKQKLTLIILMVVGVGIAVGLMVYAFNQNIQLFRSPTEVAAGNVPQGRTFRVGGLVVKDSVKREDGSLKVVFDITDGAATMPVIYDGILPDLFREGQGIVANGKMNASNEFVAHEVLAKHDENYMPPEVADALKKSGKWKEGMPPPAGEGHNAAVGAAAGI